MLRAACWDLGIEYGKEALRLPCDNLAEGRAPLLLRTVLTFGRHFIFSILNFTW